MNDGRAHGAPLERGVIMIFEAINMVLLRSTARLASRCYPLLVQSKASLNSHRRRLGCGSASLHQFFAQVGVFAAPVEEYGCISCFT